MAVPSNIVDKLIAIVKINIGRPGDTTLDDYVIEWINWSQREVCHKINFWFMRRNTTLSFAQSDTSKALPSNFKDEDTVSLLNTDNTFYRLEPMDYEDYRRDYDDVTEAQPEHYVLDGEGNIIIRPVPEKAYTVVMDYYAYLDDLVASGSSNDLLDNYPDVLETGASYRGFRYLTEWEDAKQWKGLFEEKIMDMKLDSHQRELPNEMVIKPRSGARRSSIRRPLRRR